MKLSVIGGLAVVLVMSSGCAFQKQAVKVRPKLNVMASSVGAGRSTMVNVADERPRATLGTRGGSGVGEQLTIDGDLVATVKTTIAEGLRSQGFSTDGPPSHQLRVEIRSLDYAINSGLWAGKLNVDFLLKGVCIKGDSRPYEQIYRGEFRKNIQVVQGEESNNTYINEAVSSAINKLLSDAQLLQCLAR